MTLVVATSSVGTGVRYDLTTVDDIVVVNSAYVISTTETAISGIGSSHSVTVGGLVQGAVYGVRLGDSRGDDSGQSVVVYAGASISATIEFGTVGVYVNGTESSIMNAGTISGYNAIAIGGIGIGTTSITNSGTIFGTDDGITRFSGDTETVSFHNTGMLVGEGRAFNSNGSAAIEIIQNRGDIVGVLDMGSMADIVDNRGGSIDGDVLMGDGDDTLNNRNGTVAGSINMGDGNDRLVLGAGIEIADGGAGSDTVDLRHGTGGVIDLTDEGRGTGLALGDVLTGFERVYGSTTGVDRVFGNDANNAIYTYDGNDVILGGAGNDTMYGGRGADRLTGDIGNDTFGYASVEDFGDIITDFSSSATGDNDRFQFRLAGVEAGVEAGVLSAGRLQTRADNEAQDTNDRFIFRTTDKTLWYDADGSRDGDPIMVADLQSSATVTALDIYFI